MRTRDGMRLDADVYRPDGEGPYPVLLMRQPYGRVIASTVVFAHPSWYASHGYIVAIQDVRGRGTSEGEFRILVDDVADGVDAIAWASTLPGSTGQVGMYGFSYQAMTQFMALAGYPPQLAALCPAMGGFDFYTDFVTEGGAFVLARNVAWGLQLGAIAARRAGDREAFAEMMAAARALPLNGPVAADPDILRRYRRYTHYGDWLDHLEPGPFWELLSPAQCLAGMASPVPTLHIGGWYDAFLPGTLKAYESLAPRSPAPHRLVIGPWTHLIWGSRVGAAEYGPAAASSIDDLQRRWFDRFLKGIDNGVDREAPVALFDLVAHTWHAFQGWPAGREIVLHLGGDGRAGSASNGILAPEPGPAGFDAIVHDPWRPVPSLGGHNGVPEGEQDHSGLDVRSDVACFTTAPLTETLALAGEVHLDLFVESPCPSFDISAFLLRALPDGRALVLTQGYATVPVGVRQGPVRMSLRATCATLQPGEALRLSLAGASFPAFPVNPGTGQHPAQAHLADQEVTPLTIWHGEGAPSRLRLSLGERP